MENMENNGNENGWSKEKADRRTTKIFWTEGRIVLSIFVAGIGLMFTIFNIFLIPQKNIEKNIALMQKDINVIQTNHETTIQNIMIQIGKLEEKELAQDAQIKVSLDGVLRLLTMHEK